MQVPYAALSLSFSENRLTGRGRTWWHSLGSGSQRQSHFGGSDPGDTNVGSWDWVLILTVPGLQGPMGA